MTMLRLESAWLPTRAACTRLSVTRRTLQRWANSGRIETRTEGGTTLYLVTAEHASRTRVNPPMTQARRTPPATTEKPANIAPVVAELRELLEAAQRERIDAERRAAVAEYRAEVAETDPAVVEGLREQVERLTRALDEARTEITEVTSERDQAHTALRKRYALIQRLTRRLAGKG